MKNLLQFGLGLVLAGSLFAQEPPENKLVQPMQSSWYCLSGKRMANGQLMNCGWMVAASNILPLGTLIYITYPETGKSVYAIISDRGPFVGSRDLDVSQGVARRLGFERKGVVMLDVRVVSVPTKHRPEGD